MVKENSYRAARKRKGLSSEDASKILGIARPTLSSYENDQVSPQADVLKKMCNAYDCDANTLLGVESKSQAPSAKGIPVMGKIADRSSFQYDFGKEPVEYLPVIATEPDVYGLKVVSNALSPTVFVGEYLIFKKPPAGDYLEMAPDGSDGGALELRRGESIGKIFGIYRKPK